jgi:hypothetical protein
VSQVVTIFAAFVKMEILNLFKTTLEEPLTLIMPVRFTSYIPFLNLGPSVFGLTPFAWMPSNTPFFLMGLSFLI